MGKLTDDQIKWVLSLDAGGVQGEINKTIGSIRELEKEGVALKNSMKDAEKGMKDAAREMEKLTKAGKENTPAFAAAKKMYQDNAADLKELTGRLKENESAVLSQKESVNKMEKEMKLSDMTMAQLKKRASELESQLEHTSASANPAEFKKLGKELDSVHGQMGVMKSKNQSLIQQLAGMHNPVGSAAQAVIGFGDALKALIANPVGAIIMAIVVVFMALKAIIEKNGAATEKLNQIMAPFKNILQYVLGLLGKLVDILLQGALAMMEFANKVMSVIPGLKEISKMNKEAIALEKERQKLAEEERADLVDDAKLREKVANLKKEIARKDKYSAEERIKMAREVDSLEKANMEDDMNRQIRRFNNKVKQMKNDRRAYKDLTEQEKQEYRQMEADIYNIKAEYAEKTKKVGANEAAAREEINTAATQSAKKSLDDQVKYSELALQKEINNLKIKRAEGRLTEEEYNRKVDQITLESLQKRLTIKGLEIDKVRAIEAQITDLLVKEAEKRQKILNDTQIDIDIETKNYNARLKAAGVFHKEDKDLTQAQLNEKLKIEQEYQDKLIAIAITAEDQRFNAVKTDAGLDGDKTKFTWEQKKALERLQAQHEANMLKITDEAAKKKQDAQKSTDAAILANLQKFNQEELTAIDGKEKAELVLLQDKRSRTKMSEEQYQKELTQINLLHLDDRIHAQERYVALLKAIPNPTEEELKATQAAENALLGMQQQFNDQSYQVEKSALERRKALRQQYGIYSLAEQYRDESRLLEEKIKAENISVEEAEKMRLQLKLKYAQQYGQQVQQIIGAATDAVNAIKQAETAEVQAQYEQQHAALKEKLDARLISEEEYNSQKEQLEYDTKSKELEVQKKYADAEFALKVANIGAATAMGIMNAWSSSMILGPIAGPIAAGILTGLLVATGAAQIKAANAERQRIKATTLEAPGGGGDKPKSMPEGRVVLKDKPDGFADGGYTGDGGKYEVAGYLPDGKPYHRGEYFVAQEEMRNPLLMPMIRAIDSERRKRVGSRSLPDSYGYADGGFAGQNGSSAGSYVMLEEGLVVRFEKAVERFENAKVKGDWNYWEFKEVEESVEKITNLAKKT